MHQILFWFFQRGITPEREISFFPWGIHIWNSKTLACTVFEERTHNLKPICSRHFFEVWGIISPGKAQHQPTKSYASSKVWDQPDHLILSQSLNLGGHWAPQMLLQQHFSTLPCLLLPSGNLQTPFPSIPWCYLLIYSSFFLSFLLLSLSPAELSSPCPRILRCGHTIWASFSLPWLGDHHALQLHSGFCCKPPRSSHGLCRKYSEVSYNISSQGFGSFSRFLLSRSSSHRHKRR